MDESTSVRPQNILNIMLATDNHLGYNEKDSHRGNDSFETFEEILQLAQQHDVDFILLSGDLFHDARPSAHCLLQCMKLIRKYTFGDKPISVQFLSENEFHESIINKVNYEDPNINISIPVFSIHGNHDDPIGHKHVSSLDLLSCNGLVNYYGKSSSLTKVDIEPLLMRKGETKVALYGLSHIKDERLSRLFADQSVTMVIPEDENQDELFNVLSLHQNRANRGLKKYVPEEVLPEFLDLVIWGHEHECRIEPEFNPMRKFFVTQPGSSVATSLAQGEAVQKKVAVLQIHKKEFKLTPIKLQTVRPFVFCDLNLHDLEDGIDLKGPEVQQNVQEYVRSKIEYLIEEAKTQLTGHPRQPTLPLIRLRVTFFDERQVFNTIRFGQQFMEQVANPADMIVLKKFSKHLGGKPLKIELDKDIFDEAAFHEMQNSSSRVEDIVERYYAEMGDRKDIIGLSIKAMGEAVSQLIDKDDDNAILELIEHQSKALITHLKQTYPPEEEIAEKIHTFSDNMTSNEQDALDMLKKRLKISSAPKRTRDVLDSSDEEENRDTNRDKVIKPARGRGSRGGKTGTTTSRSTKAQLDVSISSTAVHTRGSSDEEENRDTNKDKVVARGRGSRGSKTGTTTSRSTKAQLDVSISSTATSTRGRGRGARGGGRSASVSSGGLVTRDCSQISSCRSSTASQQPGIADMFKRTQSVTSKSPAKTGRRKPAAICISDSD